MSKYYTLVNRTCAPFAWETVSIEAEDHHDIWKTKNLALAVIGRSILMSYQPHNRYENTHVLLAELNFQRDINLAIEAEITMSLTRAGMCKDKLWFCGDYSELNDLCFVCLSESVTDFIIVDSRGNLVGSTYKQGETECVLELVAHWTEINIHISHNLQRKTLNVVDIRNFLTAH